MQGASQHWDWTVYRKSTSRWRGSKRRSGAGGTRAETEFGMQTRGEAREQAWWAAPGRRLLPKEAGLSPGAITLARGRHHVGARQRIRGRTPRGRAEGEGDGAEGGGT